ncbi:MULTISPECIES: site-specific integrase [Psychrobacter]|uniref:site-specific integrase n=1 Tax=Psychrobacter TaxID=497 RepID=UPI00146E3615|nr:MULTISPECIES: site-specific integrase [Psychrobacter]
MIINDIKPSKIIDELAKFDGRKKAYIPDPKVMENANETKRLEITLLAQFQTEWERLRQLYPDDINKLKPTKKHFQKASIIPVSLEGFAKFQSYVHRTVKQICQTERRIKQGYRAVNRFIDYQNEHFMLFNHHYLNINIILPKKLNSLVINNNWVTKGKQINKIVQAVRSHWEQTSDYDLNEILGWLLYSAVIYGGINDKYMLQGWFEAILNGQYQPFINKRIIISARFAQKSYGNERDDQQNQLYNTQQIIVDLVSQCWLIRYQKQKCEINVNEMLEKGAEHYVMGVLKSILEAEDLQAITFKNLLSCASYHWEMLDGADIDQASVTVLTGKQNTSGLTETNFKHFLEDKYKKSTITYDLDDILKLNIKTSKNSLKEIDNQSLHGKKIRQSDLISDLVNDFKTAARLKDKKTNHKPPTLVERIEKRRKQYSAVSEKIFISWILAFLADDSSKRIKDASLLQYIKSIGYEWLYFTANQSIESWDEDDFEILYEDILEYKATARGHLDISYYAKLLQRLHNFAHAEYNLPRVIISYEKGGRRVRAELISPRMYHAIIAQILHSVDILEKEMFALMFILVYRTGMRKKELLGLRYIDIEGLATKEPSLVVRSNSYRGLKTAGSNRRLPIFALLQPNELALFIRYVQSNAGLNPNNFIFTLSTEKNPIDDHVPLQLLKRILKDVSKGQDDTLNQTFHAFRHTAVSNLSLVLCGDIELAQALTDYNEEDINRIKYGILGEHINAQDRWYALSGIMGHLSPQRSFEYYNHVAVLMATYALSAANIELPVKTISNITGFDRKRLKENGAIIEHNNISLVSVRNLLFRRLSQHKSKSLQLSINNTTDLVSPQNSVETLFMRYGINSLWLLLQQIKLGASLEQAAITANIPLRDAQTIINRAQRVANVFSKRGNPRFVGADGLPKHIEHKSDYRLLSSLQNRAQELRDQSLGDWQWFIAICQERLSYNKAFVPFSIKENKEFQRFIKIAKRLLPEKNWLVGYLTDFQNNRNFADVKGLRAINKDNINTLNIGIALIDNRSSTNNKWQFSPLLRFFVYMVLITDEEVAILDNKS